MGGRRIRWYVTHAYGMGKLMPTDGEELERVDDEPHAGYVPESEKDDGIYDYLTNRIEYT
jgi:hypothetical protein